MIKTTQIDIVHRKNNKWVFMINNKIVLFLWIDKNKKKYIISWKVKNRKKHFYVNSSYFPQKTFKNLFFRTSIPPVHRLDATCIINEAEKLLKNI